MLPLNTFSETKQPGNGPSCSKLRGTHETRSNARRSQVAAGILLRRGV